MTFTFEQPLMFALILPVIIGGLFLLREGARRPIVISRMIVLSLLVIALASPSAIVSDVTSDENPNLVVISDETASMSLFEEGVGMNVYESLTANTPTTFIRLTGESTSLGDAIEQYSTGDNQIVLVSDGNNNFGKDIDESLQYAKEMGTTVYSVAPDLEKNDISVQMLGDKTVVIGNENQFDILVSQAEEGEIRYSFEVYAGDTLIRSGTSSQETRTRTIRVPYTFKKLGAQEMRVELKPLTEDKDNINNVYYKSVYVVPKPKIQLFTDDINAPLAEILFNLYSTTYKNGIEDINNKKTVVLDNQIISSLSDSDIEILKEYVTEGNGLVVFGGDRAYNNGNYLDSPLEELLPVISKATEWTGGETVVFLIDTSGSSSLGSIDVGSVDDDYEKIFKRKMSEDSITYRLLDKVITSTYKLIEYEELWDANAGIVAFSSEATVESEMISLNSVENRETLRTILLDLTPGSGTDLDAGLNVTKNLLSKETGDKLVIILSDGQIANSYEKSVAIAKEMKEEQSITFLFIHHVDIEPSKNYAQMFIEEVEGEATNSNYVLTKSYVGDIESSTIFQPEPIDEPTNKTEQTGGFKLVELNPNHFITRNIEIEGNITGYNDVTPKAGADRIIITATGKPVVTTWRYGLGRVATITTDNGRGGQNIWASQMYSGNNSKLISSTMNWAIGNPQVEEGTVVEAEDTWFGTPATLYITHYDGNTPVLKYKGNALELAVTGRNTYETTIDPKSIGFHDVSGYPIAVNYAIEYRDVGMNKDLPVFIKANGGKTYSENEALALLLKDARGNSLKSVQRSESQKLFFLIAALLLFLGEIAVRRIREIRESKKGD